ncbi:MAG: hypothetical protein JOY79_06690 [Acidobacteriaceae bacterium]|nr:hypothetical protein [Acidobacteriaceae bacterium]
MGPAVLVTLGVLFLIGELSPFRFHNTWPVLLIVIGVVKVLQWSSPPSGHIDPDYPAPPGPTVLPPQPPSTTDPQVPRV